MGDAAAEGEGGMMACEPYEKALELACRYLAETRGDCPAGALDVEPWENCEEHCSIGGSEDEKIIGCWIQYFRRLAEETLGARGQ